MRAHPHKFGLLGSHINSDLLSSPTNNFFATSVHQATHPLGPAQRPENSGSDTTRVRTKLDKTQHNRVIILQLATKKITSPVRYETRLGWVWVKPTKKQTIFFLTTRLKIVCYACWSQNCGRFERFENENFLGSLRAHSGAQSLLESTCPYPDSHQTRTAALRAS